MSGSGMTDVKPPPASVGQSRVGVHEISEETLEQHRLVRAGGEYVGDEGEARVDLVCGITWVLPPPPHRANEK